MADLKVTLSPELAEFVESEVRSGRYGSPTEVVIEGLAMLREQELARAEKREQISAAIEAGVTQADEGELLDGEAVMERLRRKHEALVEQARDVSSVAA